MLRYNAEQFNKRNEKNIYIYFGLAPVVARKEIESGTPNR